MYKIIMVPLDGSKLAEKVLEHVENIAQCFKSKVVFLQVIRSPRIVSSEELDWALRRQEIEHRVKSAEYYLDRLKKEFTAKGIEVHTHVVQGPVVKTIIKLTDHEEADLIAMTSHGRTGLARVFYGSVAAGVLHRIDRPLLLVRSVGI